MEPVESNKFSVRYIVVLAVLIAAIFAGFSLNRFLSTPPTPLELASVTILEPPKLIRDFHLINHRGEPFTLDSFKGKWSFVFFGYAHCPDVCPTTMHTLAQMKRILADNSDRHTDVQVVFVSVDPERDSADQLAKYVPYFNQAFIGVTGNKEEIDRVTKALGVLHVRVEQKGGQNYLMDHSASIYLIAPSGQWRALFWAPHDPKLMADDFVQVKKSS